MAVAVINGTMLTPGVSLNNRLYTPKVIAKAVARMQERIADPNSLPVIMRTHHQAGDDSRLIVGKLTAVNLEEDGSATYRAQLYGTQPGKDIAALVAGQDPALKSVSISGGWLGPVRTAEYQGKTVETADDLEIDAVDFTATPGVVGALISRSTPAATESANRDYTPISESYEATVTITEQAPPPAAAGFWEAKYSGDDMKAMLAKGHAMKNASGDPSYPVKDRTDLQKAIKAVGRGGADHDAIRRHVMKRAKALGLTSMIPDSWGVDGSMKETAARYGEIREYYPDGPEGNAGLCIDAYAGPLSVTFRACNLNASSLKAVGAAAMLAAANALAALDPDADGDIDVDGAPLEDDDHDMGNPAAYGGESVDITLEGAVLTEDDITRLVGRLAAEMAKRPAAVAEAATPDDDMESSAGGSGPDAPPAPPGDTPPGAVASHAHTHDMADGTTHTHGHVHTHETAGDPYSHTHGHTHTHLPGGDESHVHTHNHDHATDPADTHEHATEKESAVSETENTAAEAAPVQTITLEHVTALTQAITALTEAVKPAVIVESQAPETPVAESIPVVAEAAPVLDLDALKRDVVSDLRSQVLKEFGLPSRSGYRLTEAAVPTAEQERADSWKNRASLLLGDYGSTPVPVPGTGIAATS